MKPILVVLGTLGVFTAPALAGKPKPKPRVEKKLNFGDSFDLMPRHATRPRGDEIMPAPDKPRTLTDQQVGAVVTKRLPDIQHCWNKLPAKQRAESCAAILKLTIEPNGSVSAIDVGDDVPADAQRCMTQAISRWRFPTADAQTEIESGVSLRAI